VGGGTAAALAEAPGAPSVAFTPSLANAATLAAELPFDAAAAAAAGAVLFPASTQARQELARGLEARGCWTLTRLDAYSTGPAAPPSDDTAAAAAAADCLTFASPSAVKAFRALGLPARAIACIGETSATACAAAGLANIYFPDVPGVEGWAAAVAAALAGEPSRDAWLRARLSQPDSA